MRKSKLHILSEQNVATRSIVNDNKATMRISDRWLMLTLDTTPEMVDTSVTSSSVAECGP